MEKVMTRGPQSNAGSVFVSLEQAFHKKALAHFKRQLRVDLIKFFVSYIFTLVPSFDINPTAEIQADLSLLID